MGETLANDVMEQHLGAIIVIEAERDAVALTEIVLGQIPMQMLGHARLTTHLHASGLR